jgi:hypothetical protein
MGGFVINGSRADDGTGLSISNAGDLNGDGLADIIIGNPKATPPSDFFREGAGVAYVVYGKSDGTAVDLSDVAAGTGGFAIKGAYGESFIGIRAFLGEEAGSAVSSAGDVNGDGIDDVIVASSDRISVVFGKNNNMAVELSDVAAGTGGFVINGIDARDTSGQLVSNAGDVNGDGLDDVIFSVPGSMTDKGESYVVFGKTDGQALELSDLASGTGGFMINGIDAGDRSGVSISNAGDVNDDGLNDIIIGTWADESYVVYGKADGTAVELSEVAAGTGGFVINGIGAPVSNAGDVNGDGLDDLIFGATNYSGPGESYVVFGKSDSTAVELSEVSQNPTNLSSNATIVIHGKTIAIDLSSYYDGSTNDYYGAAAAVAAGNK